MQRLGLCCIFNKEPIKFRTTTVKYISAYKEKSNNPITCINQLIQNNLESLYKALIFCSKNQISSFRINSDFLPLYDHSTFGYTIEQLPSPEKIYSFFQKIKKQAAHLNIRLTFHPDHFVVLNSNKEEVLQNSIRNLEYHGLMATLLGADVINIHCGGGYGNKSASIKRFEKNFKLLSKRVQSLLTVENDDRTYTPSDLIPMCNNLNIPFVYDVHHHRCLKDNLSIEQATNEAIKTWNREPLFHISSPKNGWGNKMERTHHDFINIEDIPKEWKIIDPLTIEVEAKAKEVAVITLYEQLKKNNWLFL